MQTRKGTLVTSILYPPPSDFKFKRDLRKILQILCLLGLLEAIYIGCTLVLYYYFFFVRLHYSLSIWYTSFIIQSRIEIYRQQVQFIVIHTLSAITLVVPASLPVILMAVASCARTRLRYKKIYCNDTQAINLSGSIDCVCFDKVN